MKKGMSYMKKEAKDEEDEEMEDQDKDMDMKDQDMDMDDHGGCAKCKMAKKKSKKSKKMTKEEREFYESLQRQLGAAKFHKDEYGYWVPVKEDVLITPETPKVNDEPQPGEVGFAPSQKIATTGSNFQEWSNQYKTRKKKKK
jgi:hypothetical protein